jgi:DNA-binding CsgD family transcriptional regulator
MEEWNPIVLSMFLTGAVWEKLAQRFRLSRREIEVIRGVMIDQKESAIARQIGISPHTVHTYLEHTYVKLGVRSRATLVARIMYEFMAIRPNSMELSPVLKAGYDQAIHTNCSPVPSDRALPADSLVASAASL